MELAALYPTVVKPRIPGLIYTSLSPGTAVFLLLLPQVSLGLPHLADLKFRLLLAVGLQLAVSFSFEALFLRKVVQSWRLILKTVTNIGTHWRAKYFYSPSGLLGRQWAGPFFFKPGLQLYYKLLLVQRKALYDCHHHPCLKSGTL